jgi:hypothetical protein
MLKENETQSLIVTDEPQQRLLRSEGHGKRRGFKTGELLDEFQRFSRGPFVEILSELVHGIPTPENLATFASEHPDKWVNAIKTMANLAGYHDKLEIEGNISLDINKMGDAQLLAKLDELGEQINSMGIRTGITTIEDVEEKSTKKEGLEPKP